MNARFRNTDIINLKDFLKDLELTPIKEVVSRYGVSHSTIARYVKKYNINLKKEYGKMSVKMHKRGETNLYTPDLIDSTECDARPHSSKYSFYSINLLWR
jgi:hypothetical protein